MKFLHPDGRPAIWTPDQERIRVARLRDDDQNLAKSYIEKAASIQSMLRDGAAGREIVNLIGEKTQKIRQRQIGISLDVPLFFVRGKPVYPMMGADDRLFIIQNSSQATTAAPVVQPTGTSIRTMMQIEAPSTLDLLFVEWGASFDGTTSTNTPGKVELFGTTVAATVSTASVSGDVTLFNNFGGTGTAITFGGTTHTGFATGAGTEGTVANYRLADLQLINPTNAYVKQWPLGREFQLPSSKLLRSRVTFGTTVNMYFYAIWGE